MKKVAIYGRVYTPSAEKEVIILLNALKKRDITVIFEQKFYTLLKDHNSFDETYATFSHFNDLSNSFDLLFTIGGDGTILRAVTFVRDLDIPILGINTGRLGFLATVQKNEIKKAIKYILKEEYTIQERTLLQIETTPKITEFAELDFALNEITVSRRNTTSVIGVNTYLDGEYLTNYWADGLIVATPTGSTGYSLSCDGPVILPNSKSFVVTPIAPHNLNARPMVIPDDTAIELEVSAREKDFLISLDSRITIAPQQTKLLVKKAPFTIKTIVLKKQSYLKTLRKKLLWGEDTRNEPML